MQSWLLSVPYLVTGLGFIFLAWAAGGYAYAALCSHKSLLQQPWYVAAGGAGAFLLVVRIAVGLAVISWVAAVLGVAGLFRWQVVMPVLLPIIVLGLPVAFLYSIPHRPILLRDRALLGLQWMQSPVIEKAFAAFAILVFCAVVVNIAVGSMVPDMNQDPMWYHLSVPQQWTFSGRYDVLPDVFPSAYPLAVESLFAVLLLLKPDPVFCSLLTGLSGILLLVGMVAASFAALEGVSDPVSRGWGIAAVAAVWAPMVSVNGLMAPVQPKNDVIAALWTLCGVLVTWLPILTVAQLPSRRWWAVGGVLLGTACSAKPPILLIAAIGLIWAAVACLRLEWRERRGWPARTATGVVVAVAAMLLAMAPWMMRGWMSHGQPLFPFGRDIVKTPSTYQPLVDSFYRVHYLRDGGIGGFVQQVISLPARLIEAGSGGERCIYFYIGASFVAALLSRGMWRMFSLMLLSQLLMLVIVDGKNIVFRLFAPAHFVAGPVMAWLVASYVGHLSRPVRLVVGVMILTAALLSVITQQYRLANFHTMQWRFRPVLSENDISRYASHAELGRLYQELSELRLHVSGDERVLMLGTHYPFYLHRNVLWNDEAVDRGLEHRWGEIETGKARRLLSEEKIDVILMHGSYKQAYPNNPADALVREGVLRHESLPVHLKDDWFIYRRVRSKD